MYVASHDFPVSRLFFLRQGAMGQRSFVFSVNSMSSFETSTFDVARSAEHVSTKTGNCRSSLTA